ncbi:MAG: hypothetical protein QOH06_4403 [Acidobacteriota bacterium]|jgi:beta-phosphoglucomutase-like phosphatase (HAD superfamily)|nr:hypothetical protein [Acidobacteriota bacterium]
MSKPRLFIGSSAESIEIAYLIQEHLEKVAEVTVWDQGIFELTRYSLESLLNALDAYDCGLFVFAPDDLSIVRGEEHRAVRDNVIFELGLFIGRLGKDRSFIISPRRTGGVHLPTDLLGVNFATFNPDREDKNIFAALGPACLRIRKELESLAKSGRTRILQPAPTLVSRDGFTDYLLAGFRNPKVYTMTLVTYTGEVDSGLFDDYHVSHNKKIEIYKRSILVDLAEQQEWNMKRLAMGQQESRRWNKRRKSIQASRRIAEGVPAAVSVTQYLYSSPPSKRVYMLDDQEAMVGYYEVTEDTLEQEGSIYRGITDSPAALIKRTSPFGSFALDEIMNYIAGLRRVSRSWEEERAILLEGAPWSGGGRRPCIDAKAVFFDVDGILLDSLPLYVAAWKEAFAEVGVEFSTETAYYEEGRNGVDTIRNQLQRVGFPKIDDDAIEMVHKKRRDVFRERGPAPLQEGAAKLLEAVAASDLEIWVVTGSSDPDLRDRLPAEFPRLIRPERIITGSEARAGKPDPDPYYLACSRANVQAHQGIAIENSPLGISSADATGLFCLAVNSGILPNSELEKAGARGVFSSCADLAERWVHVLSILRE